MKTENVNEEILLSIYSNYFIVCLCSADDSS